MLTRSDFGSTLVIVAVAFVFVGVTIRVSDTLLGGLPGGAELVGWAFGVVAVLTALFLATWQRRTQPDRPFAVNVLRALGPFAVSGLVAVAASLALFYGSGQYEKGGYERLLVGLAIVVAAFVAAALVGARSVAAGQTRRNSVAAGGSRDG